MKLKKLIVLSSLVAVFAAPTAFAKARFGIVADGSMAKQTATNSGISLSSDSTLSYGGGLMMAAGLGSIDLNIGAIYQLRKVKFALAGDVTTTYPAISIPVTFGIPLAKGVGLNLGGYYAMGMGNLTQSTGGSATYDEAGVNKSDYGLRGGLNFGLGSSVLFGAYYQLGLKEIAVTPSTGTTTKWSAMGVNLGLMFGGK